jgi:Mrp family chromosome partitioning ATPase
MSIKENDASKELHMYKPASPEQQKVEKNLEKVKHIIIVMSGKGGVGKSTVAVNLAGTLKVQGLKVGVMDADITNPNIPKMLGIEEEELTSDGTSIFPVETLPDFKVVSTAFFLEEQGTAIIWRGPIMTSVIQQFLSEVNWGELDYMIIDLPPGTSDEPLSIAQNIPRADGTVLITTPQDVALLDLRKSVTFAEKLNIPIIGIIENMSGLTCPHCGEEVQLFKKGGGRAIAEELGIEYLGNIPIEPEIVNDSDAGKIYTINHANSNAAEHIKEIVNKIRWIIEEKNKQETAR